MAQIFYCCLWYMVNKFIIIVYTFVSITPNVSRLGAAAYINLKINTNPIAVAPNRCYKLLKLWMTKKRK
jgi:hypothetical protein